MNKKIKKVAGAVIAAAVLVFAGAVSPARAAEVTNVAPSYANGIRHENQSFMGLKVKRIIASTAKTTLVASGASTGAFLDAICPFGGTLGAYSMAFDTDSNAASDLITAAGFAYAVSPKVYTTNDTTSAQHGMEGCWIPPAPIKIVNGLYGEASASGHSTLYFVHCADGSNPCSI